VRARKLTITAIAVTTLAFAAAPANAKTDVAADSSSIVCNEAENSHRGGYTVSGGPVDPNPPAFLRGSQMRVGAGGGKGLVNAAERSPALRTCGVTTDVVDPEDPGDGGGPIILF